MIQRNTMIVAGGLALVFLVASIIVFQAIGGLRGEVSRLNSIIEEQARVLEDLKSTIEAQAQSLKDLQLVKDRVARIEGQLALVASAKDLEAIAKELGELKAQLSIMQSSLAYTNETIALQVKSLQDKINNLTKSLELLSERLLFPVSLNDGVGDTVVILRKPTRIVSLAPSVTETLYFIGALDLIVGIDEWSDYPRVVAEKRDKGELIVVGYWRPSVEKIIASKPDLVIGVASVPSHIALKNLLSPYGIPVLLLPNFALDDVIIAVNLAGKATGKIVEAYEITFKLKLSINYAKLLSGKIEVKPRIATIVWVNPLFVVGGGTWEHDILSIVGYNVYEDLKLWPQVSPESLLERKPDIIIVTSSHGLVTRESLLNYLRDALGDAVYAIPAVRDGKIYTLSDEYENMFVRPSPRTITSILILLLILHPQLFDVEAQAIPYDVSPKTIDVISIIKDKVPEDVLFIVKRSLEG
ncbi:MAG: helical backbone metal receptor [Acidilobaceae archaeon]